MNAVKVILVVLCVLVYGLARGQYNDSTFYRLNVVASGSYNKTNDLRSFLLNNGVNFGIRRQAVSLNLSNSWIYGQQQRRLTNNDYTGTLDLNLYTTPRFYFWGLGNYITSLSLKVNNQYQGGVGVAYNLVDDSVFFLNISDGVLYESSDLVVGDVREVYQTFRNSLRVSARVTLRKILQLKAVAFLQNSLQYSNDYIVKANLSANVQLRSWLKFNTALVFNKISRTGRENFLFTYGVVIENYF